MSTIRTLMTALLGAAGLFAASEAAMAQTKWNLPAAYPIDNPHTVNLAAFAKDVADATGGKLQITVHAAASLFKAPEIKRAVQTGQAQVGEVLISIHENDDPVFGIDVVPFIATSYVQSRKLWLASKSAVEKKLAAQGMILLFAVPWGPQGIYAMYYGHNHQFLWWTALMEGRSTEALAEARAMSGMFPPEMVQQMPGFDLILARHARILSRATDRCPSWAPPGSPASTSAG